jgi:hypothetical protein
MGQAAGLIREVKPVGRILGDIVEKASRLMVTCPQHVMH